MDDKKYISCTCSIGLIQVDLLDWGVGEKEYEVSFLVPCFMKRMRWVLNAVLGRPQYYITLSQKDAEELSKFLLQHKEQS